MKKRIEFDRMRVRIPSKLYRATWQQMQDMRPGKKMQVTDPRVRRGGAMWSHDDFNEFLADYDEEQGPHDFDLTIDDLGFNVLNFAVSTTIYAKGPNRSDIEQIIRPYMNAGKEFGAPIEQTATPPNIFIGHGGSTQWRDLKDHLSDKHGYEVRAYESGARAGHVIRDVIEELANETSFAILVMTAEDQQADGTMRARQNVIHEAGLFQGKLGYSRAILLVEDGVDVFSNVQGVNYIPFSKNNIRETYGEVLATLRREFG